MSTSKSTSNPEDNPAGTPPVHRSKPRDEVRDAAKSMQLGGSAIALAVALGLYVISLLLPHAAGLAAWQFLFRTSPAREAGITLPETIYMLLMLVGMGILTSLVLITRRAAFGLAAWMMVTVAFVSSVFVYWMRETSPYSVQFGLYLGMASALIATVTYSLVALRRNPDQIAVEQRVREAGPQLDEVGIIQSSYGSAAQQGENPLLIDDRRKRAAERHRNSSAD